MIADPVAFGMGAFGERPVFWLRELFADDEKRRLDPTAGQHVEHEWRYVCRRTVVEREREIEHASTNLILRRAEGPSRRMAQTPTYAAILRDATLCVAPQAEDRSYTGAGAGAAIGSCS